jgi:RNA polymerase primary sigma factor
MARLATSPASRVKVVSKKPVPTSAKKTFKVRLLESAFNEFCQLSIPTIPDQPFEERLRQTLNNEIGFMDNPDFHGEGAERSVLGNSLFDDLSDSESKPLPPKNVPSHLVRMCDSTVLNPVQETSLFQRMNFLRFRANQIRSRLKPETATEHDLVRIQGLLIAADWYRDKLIKSNMRLAISIVKKFVNVDNTFDDLLSDAVMAMLRAIEKFDFGKGFRFSTYATQVIRRNAYRCVMQRYTERKKVAASVDELSLDVVEPDRSSNVDEARWHQLRSRLSTMLDKLDRREKFIVRARFSLGGHRRIQTLQRLADVLGVSKERVRQLEKRALDKLRALSKEPDSFLSDVAMPNDDSAIALTSFLPGIK